MEKFDSCRDGRESFRIVKKRVGKKKDVAGVSYLKDESGALNVSVDDQKKIWKERMEKLKNVGNEWSDSIDAIKVDGAMRRIQGQEVW